MSSVELKQNLLRQLRGGGDAVAVQRAFVAVLKGGSDNNLFGGANDAEDAANMIKCQETTPTAADALECASLLKKCVTGGSADQQRECVDEFNRLKDKISTGIIFNSTDINRVKQVLNGLGINLSDNNWESSWLASITRTNEAAASQISSNADLMSLLKKLVLQVNNPTLVPGSAAQAAALNASIGEWRGVPMKEPRRYNVALRLPDLPFKKSPQELLRLKQSGGGVQNSSNTFIRLMDSVDTIINMRGGGSKALYEELSKTYESFIEKLKSQNRQIEPKDDEHIRKLLADLKHSEEKLDAVAKYILRFEELAKDQNVAADLKGLLESSDTKVFLDKLYKSREEVTAKFEAKAKNIKSIIEAVYLALQGKNSNGSPSTNPNKTLYEALIGAAN